MTIYDWKLLHDELKEKNEKEIKRLKAGAQDSKDWAESAEAEMNEAKGKLKVAVDALNYRMVTCCQDAGIDSCSDCGMEDSCTAIKALKTIQGKGDGDGR